MQVNSRNFPFQSPEAQFFFLRCPDFGPPKTFKHFTELRIARRVGNRPVWLQGGPGAQTHNPPISTHDD